MSVTTETAISRIQDFYRHQHRLPSYKEISEMFGFKSKNASFKLVQKLIELDVLGKDKKGKIIPKNLHQIPHPEMHQASITTNDFREIVRELLVAIKPLAEAHPAPKNDNKFLRVLEATYRRNTYTLLGIESLSQNVALADSAMDLMRKMIEDMVSIEYMIANGKEEMAARFQRFIWVQFHENLEFMKTTGADFNALGLAHRPAEIEKKYQEVKEEFTHKPSGQDLRSWIGKDVETLLIELHKKDVFDKRDTSRTAIGYVRSCWKNHFNPYDVGAYMTGDLLEASHQEAINHALIFGITSIFRLTTRYIDEIREVTGDNMQYEDMHGKIKQIWEKLNHE